MNDKIEAILSAIPYFEKEENIEALREVIAKRYPPNANADFDKGLDKLWALFGDLL